MSALSKLKSATKTKKTTAPKLNPFGVSVESRKPATQILKESGQIGIQSYDRGGEVWDPDRVNESGKNEPDWVHVPEESLECVVIFALNEGKGTGKQIVPVDEFPRFVEVLRNIIDTDYKEVVTADPHEYIPTDVVAKESFKLIRPKVETIDSDGKTKMVTDQNAPRDVVSIRTTSGKGAKPMTVSQAEFPAIVALLEDIRDNLDVLSEQAWSSYRAQVGTAADDDNDDDDDDSETEVELDEDESDDE